MVVQLFIAGLLVSVCAAANIQFPEKDPCILIDLMSNNSLSWTSENGTQMAIPNWNISGFDVSDGNCTDDMPYVVILFHIDNATLRFDFKNASGKVDVKMTLKFRPDKVFEKFNNTDKNPVLIKSDLMTGRTGKAFKCNTEQSLQGKTMIEKDEYALTYRIKNLNIQGFGVENGTFSNDTEECKEDPTAPPITTVTTQPVTTQHTTAAPPKTAPKVTLNVTDGNKTCAIVQGQFTFTIPYNTTKKTATQATVVIPQDVKTGGSCMNANNTDVLMAMFGDNWKMDFVFKGDSDNIWLDQLNMTFVYTDKYFPDIEVAKKNTNATFSTSFSKAFKAKKSGSYLCDSDTTTDLTDGMQMKTKDFQYTALQDDVKKFSDTDVSECTADTKTSSIVPIAVGAALAGLVVIVLIAYLIGRRRNRKGYESV